MKQPDLDNIDAFVQQQTPDFTPPLRGAKATWLGHACVLLQFAPEGDEKRGLNILFDPVFGQRCGPNQYFGAPKRYTREYGLAIVWRGGKEGAVYPHLSPVRFPAISLCTSTDGQRSRAAA